MPKQSCVCTECRKKQKKLYCKKVSENFQIRVDKTNYVWYSVLATRLDEPNRLKRCTRTAEASARASAQNGSLPWQSCGAISDVRFVVARPLHLAYARPPCGLKASLGLSLLRKRQFLHSILFFKRKLQHGLLCGLRRGIRCDWYRIACKENKNGTCSLTTCTPRFLFSIEKERFIPRSPQAPDTVLRPRRRNI